MADLDGARARAERLEQQLRLALEGLGCARIALTEAQHTIDAYSNRIKELETILG